MLGVIGDLLEDIVVHASGPPARGTDTAARIERRRGGSAANVAAAAARLGRSVRFIGRVGDDALGHQLTATLAGNGVDVRVQREGRTGAVAVLVEPGGERTMFPDRAAAAELDSIAPVWLDGLTWLHVTAYSICTEPAGSAVAEAAARVRAAGGRVSVDVSSVAVIDGFGRDEFAAALHDLGPDVVFATAAEAESLAVPPGEMSLLVVKDGPRPVVIIRPGGSATEVPVPPIGDRVADTTGAGDAFAAGFIGAMLDGGSAEDAALTGVAVAAQFLQRGRE